MTFDAKAALKRVGGNHRLLTDLVIIFLEEGPRNLGIIRDGLSRGDYDAVCLASHTLRGSLGYLGEDNMAKIAERVEKLARSRCLEELPELVSRLDEQIELLFAEMRQSSIVFPGSL